MPTVSALRASLETYRGLGDRPADFGSFWRRRDAAAEACAATSTATELPSKNLLAAYSRVCVASTDGRWLTVRVIEPRTSGPHPVVVMFHDLGRGARGWHHMTRFVALGYGVVAVEARAWSTDVTEGWELGPRGLAFTQVIDDALVSAHLALSLPWVDASRVVTWGEGLGGALAIDVAAVLGKRVWRCAAANPMPADFRGAWESGFEKGAYAGLRTHFRDVDPTAARADELFSALAYVDAMFFSPALESRLLVGVGLDNDVSAPSSQYAAFNRATCEKALISYPKWGHERINDFEDELLGFLNDRQADKSAV